MADPLALMQPYLHLDQPDPLGTATKAQNTLIQGQTIETNNRTLEGQRAAGIAIQQATGADGTLDPGAMYGYIRDNVPPEFQPAAMAAAQAAEAQAITNRSASAKMQQESIGYAGQAGGALLASNPGGISSKAGSDFVSDLLAHRSIQKVTGIVLGRTLAHAADDSERRRIIAEYYIRSLGPAGQAVQVAVTMKDGTPGYVTAGGLVSAELAPPKPKPLPLPSPAGAPPAPDDAGAAVAEPDAIGGSAVVAAGQSAAQATVAAGAAKVNSDQRDADLIAANRAPQDEADLKNMLTEAARIRLGPFTGDLAHFKAALNQIIPGAGADIEGTSTAEVLMKTAAAFARRQGAGGTDMDRGQALISNPNPYLSNLGMNLIIHQRLGDVEAAKIKGAEVRKYAAGSKALNDFYGLWNTINPQVWQYVSVPADERAQLLGAAWNKKTQHWDPIPDPVTGEVKALTEDDMTRLDDFNEDMKVAKGQGWLKGITPFPKLIPEPTP